MRRRPAVRLLELRVRCHRRRIGRLSIARRCIRWSAAISGIGAILQGKAEYNAADVSKRAERVAFLATMAEDAFPEISKDGKTKAKPEIWTNKEGFAKALKAFQDSSANLAAVVKQDNTNSAAFKAAAGKVGEACKGCHDDFRAK